MTKEHTLHFTMSAYDADSGIRTIRVQLYGRSEYNSDSASVYLENNGEGNLYTGELSCSGLRGSDWYVSEIYVEDMVGNYTNWNTWDSETGQERYTFTLDYKSSVKDQNVTLSNFRMQKKPSNADGKLRTGDTVTYTADVSCGEEKISGCNSHLYSYAGNSGRNENIELSYDETAQTLSGTGV